MLSFLCFYLLINHRSAVLAGLVFALAMSAKIVPIVAVPMLLLLVARRARNGCINSLAGGGVVFAILWIPVLVKRYTAFKTDVIGFNGYPGKWGLVEIASKLGASQHTITTLQNSGRTPFLIIAAGVPVLLYWRRPAAADEAFGLTFVLILLLSTTTGGRYLVWAIAAAFLIDVWAAVRLQRRRERAPDQGLRPLEQCPSLALGPSPCLGLGAPRGRRRRCRMARPARRGPARAGRRSGSTGRRPTIRSWTTRNLPI